MYFQRIHFSTSENKGPPNFADISIFFKKYEHFLAKVVPLLKAIV